MNFLFEQRKRPGDAATHVDASPCKFENDYFNNNCRWLQLAVFNLLIYLISNYYLLFGNASGC